MEVGYALHSVTRNTTFFRTTSGDNTQLMMIKKIICLFVIAMTKPVSGLHAQSAKGLESFPFQVIFAKDVKNGKGDNITALDLISANESLIIQENGELAMVHYFGFPVEFHGDTTISASALQEEFIALAEVSGELSMSRNRPGIEYLFKREDDRKILATSSCHSCNYDMEIIYPPRHHSRAIFLDNELCIEWRTTGSDNYTIEIKTVFDDSVATFYSSTNKLTISAEDVKRMLKHDSILHCVIKDESSKRESEITVMRGFGPQRIDYSFSCSVEKASYALMTAYFLEVSQRSYSKEAEDCYVLATQLSNQDFYDQMLDNFRERKR
jgi:hypothetical protein